MVKYRDPLPRFFPDWIQRRVEVDNYRLYEFIQQVAASLTPQSLVLDAGAGEGKYKDAFAHTKYVGVDLTIGDVAWDYSDLDIVCDLARLAFKTACFDAIICTQVLEHVQEPEKVLRDYYRVLKPGGKLFLSAPQSWYQHQKPHDYYRYTAFGLQYLLEKSGFEIESIKNMGGYFWYLSFKLQHINYWLFPHKSLVYFLALPLRIVLAAVFQLLLPLLLFYLDPLDRIKDETFGYVCIAHKPQPGQRP